MKKVLIVEDLPETRLWLQQLAQSAFPGCEVDHAESRKRGTELGTVGAYDLALVDLGLPDGSGLHVVSALQQTTPATPCVVATVMGDDTHVVAALAAGAIGYLLKEQPSEVLIMQLRQISEGVPPLSPPIARRIMDHFRLTGPQGAPQGQLTPREREVLGLIGKGLRIADTAKALGLAEGTVATHIKSVYRKLDIGNRAEAALHASRMGLLGQSNLE